MTTSLNPQQMSPLTRGLFDRQQRFQKEAGNDSSLAGIVKVNLVGRVVRLGMALILHAEAVSRAVYICFLSMQHCFSKSSKSLIQKQKVESSTALTVSLRAFFSIFYRKLLDDITIVSPPAPQPLPASAPVILPAASVSPVSVYTPPPQVSQPPIQQQPQMVAVEPQRIEVQAPQSAPVLESPPVVAPVNNEQPVQSIQLHPDHFAPVQASPREEVENINHVDGDEQHDDLRSLDGSFSQIDSDMSYSQIGLSASASRPQTPGVRLVRTVQNPNDLRTQLTADEQARLNESWKLEQLRLNAFREEYKLLDIHEVGLRLMHEMALAGSNVHLPTTQLELKTGPEHHYGDPKWKISHTTNLGIEIGICQYAENPHELKAQYLVTHFDLNIGGASYPVRLMGLFDPLIGSRASDYLSQNLTAKISEKLTALNQERLSDDGIYNAIKATFLELNRDFIEENKDKRADETFRDFIADQGSTATVVMMIDGKLWTAQLGNSRGALNSGEDAVQLNVDQNPLTYQDKIKKLGGTVTDGKVNGKLEMATVFGRNDLHGAASSRPGILRVGLDQIQENSHLILGTNGIFEIVSTQQVTNWLSKNKGSLEHLAHDLIYTIFGERQRQLKNNSLTCLVAKINTTTPNIHNDEKESKSNINSSNASFVNIDPNELGSDVSFVNRIDGNLTSLTDAIQPNINAPLD